MSSYKFRNLVFEGGGVKGAAYGGALGELEERGILNDITRVAGTSAGAITAVLLAVGYSPEELTDIIANTNFGDFADDDDGLIGDVKDAVRIVSDFGWHKGDYFHEWVGELIKGKTGKEDLTFKELNELEGSLELYLTATNLSFQCAAIFSHEHTPDVEIRDAARMSMSIPLYFKCFRYGENNDEVMVDGGVTWNYPLNIFDNIKYLHNSENGEPVEYNKSEDYVFNHETLGFRLDSSKEIEFNKHDWANVHKDINNIVDYLKALGGFILEMANKAHLHKNDWERTVFIGTLNVGATDFNLSREKIQGLIEQGRKGVKDYFEWKEKLER